MRRLTQYLNSGHEDLARIVRSEPLDFIQINYAVNAPQAALEGDSAKRNRLSHQINRRRLFNATGPNPSQ